MTKQRLSIALKTTITLSALVCCYSSAHAEIKSQTSTLNPHALETAMYAFEWAKSTGKIKNPSVITIVDFTQPSDQKRLYVIDSKTKKILLNITTAHGKHSGLRYATHFSNAANSRQSSLGVFITGEVYQGKHGESERLTGLEKGINDNAYRRAVVIHSAYYMKPNFIHQYHRAGRSWGCFAVDPNQLDQFIHLVRGGSMLFAYGGHYEISNDYHVIS